VDIPSIFQDSTTHWIVFVVYVIVNEVIRRKRNNEELIEGKIALERELSKKEQEEKDTNKFNAYIEISRYMISKYKMYKSSIMSLIKRDNALKDSTEGVMLNIILKLENRLKLHLLDNHYDKLSIKDLEEYIDYVTNEGVELIESYLVNKNIYDECYKYFKKEELRSVNFDIITTSINIKKRVIN
jgi:hypothetical protein